MQILPKFPRQHGLSCGTSTCHVICHHRPCVLGPCHPTILPCHGHLASCGTAMCPEPPPRFSFLGSHRLIPSRISWIFFSQYFLGWILTILRSWIVTILLSWGLCLPLGLTVFPGWPFSSLLIHCLLGFPKTNLNRPSRLDLGHSILPCWHRSSC